MSQKTTEPYNEFFEAMCRRLANKDCKECGGDGITNKVVMIKKKGFRPQAKKAERYCNCLISGVMKYHRLKDMMKRRGMAKAA